MKKTIQSVAAVLAIGAGAAVSPALAADLTPRMYTKAPPVVAFDPWDIAFGSAIMSDYIFRGVTQSNHGPSVTAYFEPRYNVTKDLQLYIGSSFESISLPNRAAAETDIYGGIRPTFGALALDFGVFGYLYPGGTCYFGAPVDSAGNVLSANCAEKGLLNGNVIKRDLSFYEVYGKANYTFNDYFTLGATAFYTPSFLNSGADGTYASVLGKVTAPTGWFGSSGVGMFVSGEFGRQWLGTSDSFYGTGVVGSPFRTGINYADYNTWNIGVGFTYKVFTLDLRYSDTNLTRQECNAFTSDFSARTVGPINVNGINPTGVESNWCSSRFVAKLSADLTLMSNIK